jgi:alanine racemase
MSRTVVAHVDTSAVVRNYRRLKALAPHSRTLAVVKANAYGHGIEAVGRALRGADGFGVAALDEAVALREAGLTEPIVLFAGFDSPEDLAHLRQLSIWPVLHHPAQIAMLEAEAATEPLKLWIKVDSGMHRLGFPPDELRDALARLSALPNVDPALVLMSHFASADEPGKDTTARQIRAFDEATAGLGYPHSLANSAAVLGVPQAHRDWNRPGGMLYGLSTQDGCCGADFGMESAMRLSARLVAVRSMVAGEAIGYAGAFVCPKAMTIGVAAIGYGDGYPRHAQTGTPALVAGHPARIVGRVSMDLIALDLDGVQDPRCGMDVVLWGDGLAVETVAASAGTISYDLTCGLTRRVAFQYD